jgi:endonuclease/exonuclease/phosphatase family metal-dependent hydrolase
VSALIGPVIAPDLHVMTFNVRRRLRRTWPPADSWHRRRPRLQSLLRDELPTLLGVQEALPDQADAISDALGDRYERIGRGRRADGAGEGCPVFFDAGRLELMDWSQTALSDRPHEPGSRTWGNLIPRIVVRAVFRDRETRTRFAVFNTHLDPFSRRSRARGAAHVRGLVQAAALPALVTGDLNDRPGTTALDELFADDVLRDAWTSAERRLTSEWGTFGGYRRPRAGTGRIDWIAATAEVRVRGIGINTRRALGGWPSDHLPVQAIVQLRERTNP